jgi:hypothetical protein
MVGFVEQCPHVQRGTRPRLPLAGRGLVMNSVWRGCPRAPRFSALLGLVTILGLLSGCRDTPYKIVPIHGKVTYQDGSLIPAKSVFLWFHPQVDPLKPNVHARPGIAELNPEDGTFACASTCEHGDGVVVGPHKVTVKVADESPTGAGSIPKTYADPTTTPLKIEVTRRNQEVVLEIDKPSRVAKRR